MSSTYRGVWRLEKYSRLINNTWQQSDETAGPLNLFLQRAILLVKQNEVILESLALSSNPGVITGVRKGRTLLVTVKQQRIPTRKFRILFARVTNSADHQPIVNCIKALQQYFPVKEKQPTPTQDDFPRPQKTTLPETLKKLAETQNDGAAIFPCEADLLGPSLEDAVRLCLLDPSFPDFVNSVGKCLKTITMPSVESS